MSRRRPRRAYSAWSFNSGEEQAELTLPAGQELAEVRDRMDAVGLSNCAVTAFRSRIPQLPAAWAIPERLDTLNCLAIRLTVLEDREPLKLVKYKAVLEVSPPLQPGGGNGPDGAAGRYT